MLAALGAVPLAPRDAQAMASKLDPAEAAAAAVGYVETASKADMKRFPAYKPGQNCATCSLVMLQYGPLRPCRLFPGKMVKATGWCSAWVANPPR